MPGLPGVPWGPGGPASVLRVLMTLENCLPFFSSLAFTFSTASSIRSLYSVMISSCFSIRSSACVFCFLIVSINRLILRICLSHALHTGPLALGVPTVITVGAGGLGAGSGTGSCTLRGMPWGAGWPVCMEPATWNSGNICVCASCCCWYWSSSSSPPSTSPFPPMTVARATSATTTRVVARAARNIIFQLPPSRRRKATHRR
mmetsp:Transcript_4358/g.10115  ORF Transcript_4358/g.10115 Transcript_4358/m.10115 type:complete len:203 (+) Transcript_4358:646-1254(+)